MRITVRHIMDRQTSVRSRTSVVGRGQKKKSSRRNNEPRGGYMEREGPGPGQRGRSLARRKSCKSRIGVSLPETFLEIIASSGEKNPRRMEGDV